MDLVPLKYMGFAYVPFAIAGNKGILSLYYRAGSPGWCVYVSGTYTK